MGNRASTATGEGPNECDSADCAGAASSGADYCGAAMALAVLGAGFARTVIRGIRGSARVAAMGRLTGVPQLSTLWRPKWKELLQCFVISNSTVIIYVKHFLYTLSENMVNEDFVSGSSFHKLWGRLPENKIIQYWLYEAIY